MSDRRYLSATQLDSYTRCGEAYRRRYVEGEKIPPGVAMLKGSGIHRGAEHNFRQKIASHADLPAADIIDAAVAGFEAEAKTAGVLLTPDEESRGGTVVMGEAVDEVAAMATVHAREQAPEYQPVWVEQSVRLALPGPRDLLGVVDLADDQGRVVDFKTAGKAKSQDEADTSVQLTVYAALWQSATGEPAAGVRLDTLVSGAKGVKRQVLASTRDERDFEVAAARINAVGEGIEKGVFAPAPPGAWWCSATWCGYHATCPYVRGKR